MRGTASAVASRRDAVTFEQLADDVWTHTSVRVIDGWGPVESNGLILRVDDGVVLIDTAWNDAQTREVLTWIDEHLASPVRAAVLTHAHDDKMGGVAALRNAGVPSFAHALSNTLAPTRGLLPADHDLVFDERGELAEAERVLQSLLGDLDIFFPGAGHSKDNIVVGFPSGSVLFGGCLIRSADTNSLGNTLDGDVDNWSHAVELTRARFPTLETVVPSHGAPASRELLDHTSALAAAAGAPATRR